jgi:hypothetical protein
VAVRLPSSSASLRLSSPVSLPPRPSVLSTKQASFALVTSLGEIGHDGFLASRFVTVSFLSVPSPLMILISTISSLSLSLSLSPFYVFAHVPTHRRASRARRACHISQFLCPEPPRVDFPSSLFNLPTALSRPSAFACRTRRLVPCRRSRPSASRLAKDQPRLCGRLLPDDGLTRRPPNALMKALADDTSQLSPFHALSAPPVFGDIQGRHGCPRSVHHPFPRG